MLIPLTNIASSAQVKVDVYFPFNRTRFTDLLKSTDGPAGLNFALSGVTNGLEINAPFAGKVALYKIGVQADSEQTFMNSVRTAILGKEVTNFFTGTGGTSTEDLMVFESLDGRYRAAFWGILGNDKAVRKDQIAAAENLGTVDVIAPIDWKWGIFERQADGSFKPLVDKQINWLFRDDSLKKEPSSLKDTAAGFGAGALVALVVVAVVLSKPKKGGK